MNESEIIKDFAAFLASKGFAFVAESIGGGFGDRVIEWSDGRLTVRIVRDRGHWSVDIRDADDRSGECYEAALLRDLVVGGGLDVLSLSAQIDFLESNWDAIADAFSPNRIAETKRELRYLYEKWLRRRLPGLFR